jgi:adenylate cyclase
VKQAVGWLERNGLWGIIIAFIIMGTISLSYYYEKEYESRSGASEFGYYSRLEFPFIDLRHKLMFDSSAADDDIVIVTITETALDRFKDRYGRWPWPRRVMARVVNYLRHAESVLLDIGFVEPSGKKIYPDEALRMRKYLSAAVKLRERNERRSSRYLSALDQKLQRFAQSGDRRLGKRLETNGAAFTATWFVDVTGGTLPQEKVERLNRLIDRFGYRARGNPDAMPKLSYVIPPVEPVLNRSYGLAHISFTPDPDGPARRFSPFVGLEDWKEIGINPERPYLPILGMAGALKSWGLKPGESDFRVTKNRVEIGPVTVPLDRKGRVLIRYKGGLRPRDSVYSTYEEIPIETIIGRFLGQSSQGAPPPEYFKGKTVLIGSTASGAHDLRATPFSAQEAGVAIHANILDMFLNKDFLHPIESQTTVINILLWTTAVGLITTFLSPMIALVLTVLLTALFMVMGFGLFEQGYLINLSAPLLSSYLTYSLVTVYNLTFEQRKRRQVRNAFESYLASNVMEEVLQDPDSLELGGERREITVMFADISGFTRFSEGRTATEVASVIGDVMTALTECVFRYEGVLDKYIGDELVAEFGIVPGEPSGHARRAVKAAVDMLGRLAELQEEWRRQGREVLDLRIGLHTGMAATGNMGSEMLFDYTAIGDNVNLGSRLEGANKQYGTRCMISDPTYQQVKDLVEVRELDTIIVKGKEEPIVVYELLGRKGEVEASRLALRDQFEDGLELYRSRQWDAAADQFESILEEFGDDEPSRVFLERSRRYSDDPPPEDWDGEFRLTSK